MADRTVVNQTYPLTARHSHYVSIEGSEHSVSHVHIVDASAPAHEHTVGPCTENTFWTAKTEMALAAARGLGRA